MDMYQVSLEDPPSFNSVDYWERSLDPHHPKAFVKVFGGVLKTIMHFGIKEYFKPRAEGWAGINCENVIVFTRDGTFVPGRPPQHLMGRSSLTNNICAYPVI